MPLPKCILCFIKIGKKCHSDVYNQGTKGFSCFGIYFEAYTQYVIGYFEAMRGYVIYSPWLKVLR
jgi:hypothetical protein